MRTLFFVVSLWLATNTLDAKIVFHSKRTETYQIYTMNADGSNQTQITFSDHRAAYPIWSPNGRQIVFTRFIAADHNEEVFVMDADGTNQRNLSNHPGYDSFPEWSPDGSLIVFTSDRHGGKNADTNLFVMSPDGEDIKQITKLKWAMAPRWSPDGKQILYSEAIESRSDKSKPVIATLDFARREVIKWQRLPVPKGTFSTSDFSADGKSILFSSQQNGDDSDEIYRFVLADRQLIQLTNSPGRDAGPHEWSPRLAVSPQELTPTLWGEIKSNQLQQ